MPNCNFETSAHIARFSHLGNISYRLGRKVFWDSESQQFINDDEANKKINSHYRFPWKFHEI